MPSHSSAASKPAGQAARMSSAASGEGAKKSRFRRLEGYGTGSGEYLELRPKIKLHHLEMHSPVRGIEGDTCVFEFELGPDQVGR